MRRRDFVLGAAGGLGAIGFAGDALADIRCFDAQCNPYNGYCQQVCEVGIPSDFLHVVAARRQRRSQWCWAACIEMVFAANGFFVPQEQFVAQTFGDIENMPGSTADILRAVSRTYTDIYGRSFQAFANLVSYDVASILVDLKDRYPLMFWDDIQDDLARQPTELSKHYPQFFPPSLPQQPLSQNSHLADKIAMTRYEALREISALRRGCLPSRNHPDMDWWEACEVIALSLGRHAKHIGSIAKEFGAELPRDVLICLEKAEAAAEDGNFDLAQFALNGNVPKSASEAADTMYEKLKCAEDLLRSFLEQHHGLKF
jgi:hypothetical protein